MPLRWEGPPPTRAELATLRQMAARGELPRNGVVRRVVLPNPPEGARNRRCWAKAKRAAVRARAANRMAFANYWYHTHCGSPRENPANAFSAYREFHWGEGPEHVRRVRLPSYDEGVYALGKLRAVEYEASKGGERAVWVHQFSKPYPTLTGTPRGKLGPIVGGAAFITERGIER